MMKKQTQNCLAEEDGRQNGLSRIDHRRCSFLSIHLTPFAFHPEESWYHILASTDSSFKNIREREGRDSDLPATRMCFTHAAVSRQIYDADRCERRKLMRSFDSTLVCSSLYLAELHYHLTRSGVLIDYMKRYTSLGVRSLFRLNSSKSWFSLTFLPQVLLSSSIERTLSRCIFSLPS